MTTPILPRAQASPVGSDGNFTAEWRRFFDSLLAFVGENSSTGTQVAAILERLNALEADDAIGNVQGLVSVQVFGALANGIVRVQLRGDAEEPGNTYYYGTGPDGVKGWFTVESALAVDAGELTKAVGADGVTTLGLASVADSGAGALLAISRDGFGRVTGTKAATITAGSGINVANGDAVAGLPTVSHADTSSVANLTSDNSNGVVIQDLALTFDALGHVTGATVATVDLDDRYKAAGYIDGLMLQWVSATALTVATGSAYIEGSGKIVPSSAAIAKAGLALSASTWYHVYLYLNAGTPDVEIVTTAPVVYSGTARSKTGDTSRRYLGSVLTDGAGNLYNFLHVANRMQWRLDPGAAPFRVLSGGVATVATSVSLAGAVPVTSRLAQLRLINLATNAAILRVGTSDDSSAAGIAAINQSPAGSTVSQAFLDLPIDSSQAIEYNFTAAPAGSGAFIDVYGYTYER